MPDPERPLLKVAHRPPVACAPGTSVRDAVAAMVKSRVGAIVVVERDRLVGIFTERDLMVKVSKIVGAHVTLHDLRRTYTTVAISECRVDLYKAELLTNHVPKGVTARHYLETSRLQYLHPETQRVGDWIEQQAAIATSENVKRFEPPAEAA